MSTSRTSRPLHAPFTRVLFLLGAAAGAAIALRGMSISSADPAWGALQMKAGAGVAVVLGVCAFLGASVRLNLSITLGVVIVASYAFNYYLAVREVPPNPVRARIAAAANATPGYDHRTPMEVVRDLRKKGVPAVPGLYGVYALREHEPGDIIPLAGIATATTVLCNESRSYAIYQSDERGFNNPPGLPEEVDVVVLGDSYGHGHCVNQGEDVAGRLRAMGYRAVNLACSGNGPLLELATLVEYGIPMKPKVALWLFYEMNDGTELNAEVMNPTLSRYLTEDGFRQNLLVRQEEIDTYWRGYLERFEASRAEVTHDVEGDRVRDLLQILTLWHLRSLLGLRRIDSEGLLDNIARVVGRADRLARENGIELYFVNVPSWERYEHHLVEDGEPIFEALANLDGPRIKTVNFHDVLVKREDPRDVFPFKLTGHYTAEGYALLAEHIAREALANVPRANHPIVPVPRAPDPP